LRCQKYKEEKIVNLFTMVTIVVTIVNK